MKTLSLMLYMQHITGQLLIILLLKLFILKKIERPKRKLFFYWLANFFTVYKEHLITVEFQLYRLGQVYITCIVYKKCTGCSQRNI